MNKKINIKGSYKLEEAELYKQGEELHLRTGMRHKARKGAGMRYIGAVERSKGEEEKFYYISSLYPSGRKNIFRLDYEGEALELEIKNAEDVEIRPSTTEYKLALVYEGEA